MVGVLLGVMEMVFVTDGVPEGEGVVVGVTVEAAEEPKDGEADGGTVPEAVPDGPMVALADTEGIGHVTEIEYVPTAPLNPSTTTMYVPAESVSVSELVVNPVPQPSSLNPTEVRVLMMNTCINVSKLA